MAAYYNEIDAYAAQWLRNLIQAGHIAPGEVDERSIVDVQPDDLKGFTQCHFFAGIGGWSYAARLAGWPDERELWTGSCPCQPFSVAGKGEGQKDERHLWPEYFRLIRARAPAVVMGEQVAAAVGKDWLDGVCLDLEGIDYTCGAAVVPACAVDAPHRRDRLWFVADTQRVDDDGWRRGSSDVGRELHAQADIRGSKRDSRGAVANTNDQRSQGHWRPFREHGAKGWQEPAGHSAARGFWNGDATGGGVDGKSRRIEPSIRLLAHGVPGRVGQLRAYGNAIVPQVAAEVIGAYLDMERAAA